MVRSVLSNIKTATEKCIAKNYYIFRKTLDMSVEREIVEISIRAIAIAGAATFFAAILGVPLGILLG